MDVKHFRFFGEYEKPNISFILLLFLLASVLENKILVGLFLLLLIPLGLFSKKLYQADTIKDFRQLSSLCKLIMLLGLLTMMAA